jgi:hypothetical protein
VEHAIASVALRRHSCSSHGDSMQFCTWLWQRLSDMQAGVNCELPLEELCMLERDSGLEMALQETCTQLTHYPKHARQHASIIGHMQQYGAHLKGWHALAHEQMLAL